MTGWPIPDGRYRMADTGWPIDDAMVNVGEMDEGRCQERIGRTALLQLLHKHGYDGKGGRGIWRRRLACGY